MKILTTINNKTTRAGEVLDSFFSIADIQDCGCKYLYSYQGEVQLIEVEHLFPCVEHILDFSTLVREEVIDEWK